MRCLTGARFTMSATVLRQTDDALDTVDPDVLGTYEEIQDPLTGEIMRVWVETEITPDDPSTPDVDERRVLTIPCMARGIVDGGIRVAGTTERFGDTYENIDYVKMWVPASVQLTKRDRITNIREARTGKIIWIDEEFGENAKATMFNVNGVTPLLNGPFNKHTESFILLERAEVS